MKFSSMIGVTMGLMLGQGVLAAEATRPEPVRVYSQLQVPAEHPDYSRRAVKPPGWENFDNQTQFITLRGFRVEKDEIVDFQKTLDSFTVTHDLGRVVWPSYPILFANNLNLLADEIKKRQLYLFDIWGYVPGSGPGGYWQQFQPPATVFKMLEEKLGERWLGTDIGEQDGRYVGGYAGQMTPATAICTRNPNMVLMPAPRVMKAMASTTAAATMPAKQSCKFTADCNSPRLSAG